MLQDTHEWRANKNIGRVAGILAMAVALLFPLAASAAEDKASRAPARPPAPAAAPAKSRWKLLDEAELWRGWGENRVWDFSGEVGGIRLEKFLIKPHSRRGCGVFACDFASATCEDTIADYTKTAGGAEVFTGCYVSAGVDGRVARIDAAGVPTYYMSEPVHGVHQVTNAAGAVVRTQFTDAWGNDLDIGIPNLPTGPGDRYGFQGREKDNESGLHFFRARSYDPMTGRFTSRDPVPYPNLYYFVANDPVNKTDPTGRDIYNSDWDKIKSLSKRLNDANAMHDAATYAAVWTEGQKFYQRLKDQQFWWETDDSQKVDELAGAWLAVPSTLPNFHLGKEAALQRQAGAAGAMVAQEEKSGDAQQAAETTAKVTARVGQVAGVLAVPVGLVQAPLVTLVTLGTGEGGRRLGLAYANEFDEWASDANASHEVRLTLRKSTVAAFSLTGSFLGGQSGRATWENALDARVGLGPFANESIPLRGPGRNFNAAERGEINLFGYSSGCHTCGTTTPGTKSGNFIIDHQPPVSTSPGPYQGYPHCDACSRTQGGVLSSGGGTPQTGKWGGGLLIWRPGDEDDEKK